MESRWEGTWRLLRTGSNVGRRRMAWVLAWRGVEDCGCYSFAIVFTADLPPTIGAFVVDPRYARDDDQRISGVTNGSPSFLFAALLIDSSLDAGP